VTRPEQDEDERSFILEMVQRLGLELERDPVQLKPPNPDAELLLRGGRRVGLEIIEAHAERLRKAWNSTSRAVARRITEELRAHSIEAEVPFRIEGDAAVLLTSRRRLLDETARLIAEFARDVINGAEPRFSQARAQKRGIQHIVLLGVNPPLLGPEAIAVMTTAPLGPGLIQAAIEAKQRKLAGYRSAFGAGEYWLLIVGGLPISGYVTAADAMAERFISPFDKTVFLDRGSQCICLETEAPDPLDH
jgi:hypothetical protein